MPEKGKVKCKRARAQDLSVYLPFPEPKADRTRSTWLFVISETPEICFFFFFLNICCSKEHEGHCRGILRLTLLTIALDLVEDTDHGTSLNCAQC